MTTYIQWAKHIDSDFRAFYPTISLEGEVIEGSPAVNDTHSMVGTSRLDAAGRAAISAVFGGNVIFTETAPEGFESDGFGV